MGERKGKRGGFRLRKDPRNGNYICRFYVNGIEKKLSTRTRDPRAAKARAAQLYAEAVSGRRALDPAKCGDLAPIVAEWLADMEGTVSEGSWNGCEGTWRVHLLPRFSRIELLTEASCEDYDRARLRKVSRATVKKERATLVQFVRWASIRGRDYLAPMDVPSLPKKAKGTKALDGRDKTHITRAEVLAILDRLPERSRAGHPVKAFATLAAELGIRRETMDRLEVPKHYEPGTEFLRLSADVDKERNGRPLWLSPRARVALEAVAPARGRIFSGFHYLKTFRAAARGIVGEERARHLTVRDLRHRCLTDIAEREGLAAAAYVGGHSSTEMAGRVYVSPQADSAEAALRARAREDRFKPGTEPGTDQTLEAWAAILSQDSWQTRRDSNPRPLPPEGSALSS